MNLKGEDNYFCIIVANFTNFIYGIGLNGCQSNL